MLPQKDALLKRIVQGDKDSFEEFFKKFFPKLYLFSCDFVKDRDIARELAHESFVKFWETKDNLQPDSNIEAYLTTVCKNKCLNYLKHQKVIFKFQEVKIAEQTENTFLSNVLIDYNLEQIDFDNLFNKINQTIQSLPDQCRIVFELSRFKKKKYSEIASDLNISSKTVEAHISLALKRLRAALKDFL